MMSYLRVLLFILSVSVFDSEGGFFDCICKDCDCPPDHPRWRTRKTDLLLRFGRKKRDTDAATAAAPFCQTTCYSAATVLNITAQDRCATSKTSATTIGLALESYDDLLLQNLPIINYGESVKLSVPSAVASPYIQVGGLTGRYRLAEIHFFGVFQPSGDLILSRQLVHEKEGQEGEVAVLGVAIHVPENELRKEDDWPFKSHREKWLTKAVSDTLQTIHEPGNEARIRSLQVKKLLPSGSDYTYFFHYAPCSMEITVKTNVSLLSTETQGRSDDDFLVLPMF